MVAGALPPYDQCAPPFWGEEAVIRAGGWEAVRAPVPGDPSKVVVLRWTLQGPCPRCGSDDGVDAWVSGDTVLSSVSGFTTASLEIDVGLATESTPVSCTTRADIPGRPEKTRGCGASGDAPLVMSRRRDST
jgi:hypothetical protein